MRRIDLKTGKDVDTFIVQMAGSMIRERVETINEIIAYRDKELVEESVGWEIEAIDAIDDACSMIAMAENQECASKEYVEEYRIRVIENVKSRYPVLKGYEKFFK